MSVDRSVRRLVEAVVAAVLLVVALPLILLTAMVSLAVYRAWPFFVQDRVGLGGQTFRIAKVRTLPPSTAAYADKYSLGRTPAPAIMLAIRRLHLDELPQLLHVATGHMGFVGPRPEMPNLHAELAPAFAAERVSVRPGLTGLWQISPHSSGLIGERPEYDRLYIAHRTAAFDTWILYRTVLKMVSGRTVHLHEVPARTVAPVSVPLARFEIVEPVLDLTTEQARSGLPSPAMAGGSADS